jgi:hypothetical protein
MGYHVDLIESDFEILKSNNENSEIVEKIKKHLLDSVETCGGGGTVLPGGSIERWYSWVNNDEIRDSKTIADLLIAFRYEPDFDAYGNIVDLTFFGEKLGDENFFFSTISPYVEKGSSLSYRGEDGCLWLWEFNGESIIEKTGRVVFD